MIKPLKFVAASLFFVGIGLSVNADGISCLTEKEEVTEFSPVVVKKPTWWGWITDSNTTQFHFFDLIELMYGEETNKYPEFSDNTPSKSIR